MDVSGLKLFSGHD